MLVQAHTSTILPGARCANRLLSSTLGRVHGGGCTLSSHSLRYPTSAGYLHLQFYAMPQQPFHPDLASLAKWLPTGLPVTQRWHLLLLRALSRFTGALAARGIENVPLPAGASYYLFRPSSAPRTPARVHPALLWVHGGGLVLGDARVDEAFLQLLADDLGLIVASVDYRLAPEYPFPAPLDDCEAAFRHLAARSDVDARKVAVGGVSAGGGLATVLCQRLRGSGIEPNFQLLAYPMLDNRSALGAGELDSMFRIWDRSCNAFGWCSYLGGTDDATPYAVPARAEDLSRMPPAWIGVGSLDLFYDEDVAYAQRLETAAIPVELCVVDGAYHAFDVVDANAAVSLSFRRAQVAALTAWLSEGTDTPVDNERGTKAREM